MPTEEQKDEFLEAFKEAVDNKPADEVKPEKSQEQEEKPAEEPEDNSAKPQEATQPEKEEAPAEEPAPVEEKEETVDYKAEMEKLRADLEKERQRRKSLEGMFNADKKRQKQQAKAVEEPKTEESASDSGTPAIPNLMEEVAKVDAIKEFRENYPEVWETNEVMLKAIDQKFKQIEQTLASVAPMYEHYENDAMAKHMAALQNKISQADINYSDFEKWRDGGELEDWIVQLPSSIMRDTYLRIYNGGSPDDVAMMVKEFAKSTGKVKTTQRQPSSINEEKLKANEGVRSNRSPVNVTHKKAGVDDYEGAWNEAVRS